jgi:RNA recognition motif-containing protein
VNNILVGNLGPNVTEQDIRPLFEKHGVVQRFKMMTDRWTGLSRGFGFIQMKTDAEAEKAIGALNGTDFNGKALEVKQARPQLHRGKAGTIVKVLDHLQGTILRRPTDGLRSFGRRPLD